MAPRLLFHASVRVFRSLVTLAGLAIVAILIVRVGSDEALIQAARGLGWRSLLVCVPFGLIMVVDTLGWRYAFAYDRVPFLRLVAARVAGEAVNVMTAVAPVGGDAIKVWFLRPHVPYRESIASVIIAKTTITLSQTLFLLAGVVAAVWLAVDPRLVRAMLWLLLVELIGAGGFLAVQVAGFVSRGARLLERFKKLHTLAAAENLDRTLQSFYRREWKRFGLSVGSHLLGWLMGALETWLFLRVLQIPASLTTALVIETLGSAVRFATFFVPGSLGALEGANTAAFAALGLGAPAGLAFSLLRRLRQVVWIALGVLVLLLARALMRRAPEATESSPAPPPPPRPDAPADDRGFQPESAAAARPRESARPPACAD
jgi:glycosyltransferase 2 family protein